MTRRTALVLTGCVVLGGAFGAGTAIASAQTSGSPSTNNPSTNNPSTSTTVERQHNCPHMQGGQSPESTQPGGSTNPET